MVLCLHSVVVSNVFSVVLFLCLRQTRLESRGIMFSFCLFICSSVPMSVLQICHHSQTVVHCQCMVGVYNSYQPSAPRGTYQTRRSLWSVWRRCFNTHGNGRLSWRRSFSILYNSNHVLHLLLPDLSATRHYLRHRRHYRVLPPTTGTFQINNFLIRQLYNDAY